MTTDELIKKLEEFAKKSIQFYKLSDSKWQMINDISLGKVEAMEDLLTYLKEIKTNEQ